MLDEGYTLTMETAMLEDIVLPPTLARRLLSAAGISGYGRGSLVKTAIHTTADLKEPFESQILESNEPALFGPHTLATTECQTRKQ